MSVKPRLFLLLILIAGTGFYAPEAQAGRKYHYYSRNPHAYRSYSPRNYYRKRDTYRPATYSYYQQREYGQRKYSYTVKEYMRKVNRYDKVVTSYYGYGYPFGIWGYPFYRPGFWRGYWGSYYGAPYRYFYNRPWYYPYGGGYYFRSMYVPWYLRSPADLSTESAQRELRSGIYGFGSDGQNAVNYPINPKLLEQPVSTRLGNK